MDLGFVFVLFLFYLLSQATSSQVSEGSKSDLTYSLIPEPPADVFTRLDFSSPVWKFAMLQDK